MYVVSISELGGYVSLADLGTSWALLLGPMGGLEGPSGALWQAWVDLVGHYGSLSGSRGLKWIGWASLGRLGVSLG